MFVQVSAGNDFTCGITIEEKLKCWGLPLLRDHVWQGAWLQVSAGPDHVCALRKDGFAECQGACNLDQCAVPPEPFVQVVAGTDYSCGIRSDGTATCWGFGAVRRHVRCHKPSSRSAHDSLTHTVSLCLCTCVRIHGWQNALAPPTGVQFTQLSAGREHTVCGIMTNATMLCWGHMLAHPEDGQLFVREGSFVQASIGRDMICGLLANSQISCEGNIFHLVDGDSPFVPSPETEWMELVVRDGTICAVELAEPNTVRCWGGAIAKAMPRTMHAAV